MSIEMAIWRITDHGPQPLSFSQLGQERRLEDLIVADPSLTGLDLLVLGRQISTTFGGYVDVLGLDSEGRIHVLELKRDKTPREVVAQTLDYGSWAQSLSLDQVREIYAQHSGDDLGDAFALKFGSPVPDVFNADQQLTIVASVLDAASDRIVEYLSSRYGVPLNAVFFRYFADGESEYLARTWLIAPDDAEAARPHVRGSTKVRSWNGRDFYVVMGSVEHGADRWTAGSKYGFVGAGGGEWYWKPLKNLTPGARVFAYVGGAGYVGVGEVSGELMPLRELETTIDGRTALVIEQPDVPEVVRARALSPDPQVTEFAVPVRWMVRRPPSQAVKEPGLFASQVTACKLRDERTIDIVTTAFELD